MMSKKSAERCANSELSSVVDETVVPSPVSNSSVSNSWAPLKRFTDARIGLGRAGNSLPTRRMLEFQMDHANARDAVHIPLDTDALVDALPDGLNHAMLSSQASDRATYLQRPDLGRTLSEDSGHVLASLCSEREAGFDAVIVVCDGLSSTAVQAHAAAMVEKLCVEFEQRHIKLAPICIVQQGRVGIGDDIAQKLGAEKSIVLIGERPGLSSPDSLGLYYTFKPEVGLQDSSRNCISNIRPAGLSFDEATDKLLWLMLESDKLGESGVNLKDESEAIELVDAPKQSPFRLS